MSSSGRKNLQLVGRLQELALTAETLALHSGPYAEVVERAEVPLDNTGFPQLQPFSNLVPERLKITGRGQWDAPSFIEPEHYMAFQEPQVIQLDRPMFDRALPNFPADSPETMLQLFQKWDSLGLLELHPKDSITTGLSGRVKIFNAFKSAECGRQIGDRRERNGWEARIPGPSAALPIGSLIGRLCIPEGYGVRLCVTDMSDYYHQISVSHERSRTNIVWPPMPLQSFVKFEAYQRYLRRASARKRPTDRTVHGDQLDGHRPDQMPLDPRRSPWGRVWNFSPCCFASAIRPAP